MVDAARCSFDKTSSWVLENGVEKLSNKDIKLVNYLSEHQHIAPFFHSILTVRMTTPIFLARQLFKSQIGFAVSEVSRRYVTDEPDFFMPDAWRLKHENKKQGSSDESIMHFVGNAPDTPTIFEHVELLYQHSLSLYNIMIENNIAPELARMVLPQSMMTTWIWTGSLAAWTRMINLRNKPDSQKENHIVCEKIEAILKQHFPVSYEALITHQKEE